jgi:flagellar hook-associated protein 2
MASISSPGLGSGLDINSIVSQLVALERKPIDKLKSDASAIQTKISAYGQVQSLVSGVKDAANKLAQASLWNSTTALSSDTSAVSASSSSTNTAVTGTYQVEVTKLAQAHQTRSGAFASATTALGTTGTLGLRVGSSGTVYGVQFTATDTLETLRDKINGAGAGVTANIVTGTIGGVSGAYLMLRSGTSGADGTITTPSSSGLPAALSTLTTTVTGQDAEVKVDGVTITSATNTVTDAPTGVTLSLQGVTTNPVKVTVNADKDGQRKAIDEFVSAYNSLNSYLAENTKYDENTKKGAALQGDSGALSVRSLMRNALRQTSTGSSAYQTLSSLGFSMDAAGALTVKESTLNDALAKPAELGKLFSTVSATGTATRGLALKIRDVADALTASDGIVTSRTEGLRTRLKRNEKDQDTAEDRVERVRQRLLAQYSSLDTKMSTLNGLSSYVTQQLAAFNNSSG